MTVPVLRSARLTLRAMRAEDHADLLALAQDPEAMRFMHEGPPPSPAEVWNRMAGALGQWALRGYGMMVAEDGEGFAGRLGFFHPYGGAHPLLVYALARRCWGRGYATEGVGCALGWLAQTHGSCRVTGHIDPANLASAQVARKLGALRDGTAEWAGVTLDRWVFRAP